MTRRRVTALVLVVFGGVWLLVNSPVEGPVLVRLTPGHGLTTADLLSVLAFLIAGWLWFVPRRLASSG